MPEPTFTTALLGPTNTGKTHRAVEQMLTHDSGMIGLPLRLLAREVYDRISERVGEERVALVTGEEKRVPRRPAYWVCTVEAMPLDREVDFLAVDEVQLCGHPQRGHVFTDRLLRARGRRETYFLGSDTAAGIVSSLVPTARIESHPRLSRLLFSGRARLPRLPPRTAVVAFSTPHVYELAERLKQVYGGVAVVLGALSPRTRNAQVAMFQAGEVDYLVATDAIGMGLNLAVDRVAFAALRKFDGRESRDLEAAELGQIAGRAGRFKNDGAFGTVAPLELPPGVAAAIEAQQFPSVRRAYYRNADLDFASVDALMASLRRPAPSRLLRGVGDAEDFASLVAMAARPEVRALARDARAVRLLWEVCTIPDFRKLLLETHVGLLAEIYPQLAGPSGVLEEDWLARRVADLDDPRGDIDTLTSRIAAVRTWAYVAYRGGWVPRAAEWQARTRAVEDRLSDALHERLVERFVERGAGPSRGARARSRSARTLQDELDLVTPAPIVSPAHPFAGLADLRARLSPPGADRARARPWVDAVIDAQLTQFELDAGGRIVFEGRALARLVRGARLVLPDVELLVASELRAGAHARLQRRLVAVARDLLGEIVAPLREMASTELTRPLYYPLEQKLGTVRAVDVAAALAAIGPEARSALSAAGIEIGRVLVYLPSALRATARRAVFLHAYYGPGGSPAAPRAGAVSLAPDPRVEPEAYTALGYPVFGTRALRADVAERVARALHQTPHALPEIAVLATWMGCPAGDVAWVVESIREGLVGPTDGP